MIIPPEKVVALLNGSAGGGPRGEAGPLTLTRREIAAGLQVRDNDAFRELIRSMTAAGYLRRVHEQGRGWCYTLGRPLDARMRADDPPPGVREEEYRRARDELARLRQRPRGTRPNVDPTGGKIVHGVEMRPAALCGRDVTNLPTDIPLLPGADLDLLNQRETCTMLVEDATCPACIAVRDRPVSGAGPVGRRPGQLVPGAPEPFDATAENVVHGANRPDKTLCFVPLAGMPEFDITVAHGCPSYTRDLSLMTCAACLRVGDDPQVHGQLPGVPEFTACGEAVDDLHNPGDRIVDTSKRWPAEGSTITCTPCRMALDLFAADDERRRQGDAAAAAGEIVHLLVGGRAGNGSSCRIERTQQPPTLPEGHSLTVYPAGINCAVCIDLNGGHRGANDRGFNEGRAAADGPVDTTQRPPANFVQGLAAARAETFARWLAAAEAQYAGRCTFNGPFNSEHPYEHDAEAVASSMMGNSGIDEWERCSAVRADSRHIGDPDADAAWLAELFEFELCHECGQDAGRHRVRIDPIGNRFAECVDEAGTPMGGSTDAVSTTYDDDRCTFNRLELSGPHAFTTARPPEGQEGWDICEQPRNAPVHQVEGSRAGLDDWTPGDFGPQLDRPLAGEATPVDGECMVSEQEIGTPHRGLVRAYRATDSNGRWLVCDGHIAGARGRLAELGHSAGLVGVDVADDEQAAHDAEFFRRLFAERPCLVCGAGPEGHRVERRDEGHSVPVCINPPADSPVRADQMAGPCTFYGVGFDGPHVFVFDDESRPEHLDPAVTCGQPRSASVHVERGEHVTSTGPAELESLDINAHQLRDPADEEGFSDYREGRRDFANEQVDEERYWTNGDYAQGVRDEYVIAQRAENDQNREPEGWAPPEPRWTARTFEGEPAGFADQAEEAWRHRVERIDHWRRQGRISDREATALLAPMSPGAAIDEEQAWRRNGTAARFDPEYADEVERLSLDADNGHGVCRYCGESLGHEHAFVTGDDGRPVMEHAPWDYTEGHGTRYDGPGIAAAAELVPGDPVMSAGRHGIFQYLDDSGTQAFVIFEGQTNPEQVPAGSVHPHGASR